VSTSILQDRPPRQDIACSSPADPALVFERVCRALAEAKTVCEAKDVFDEMAAIKAYARIAGKHDLEADCVEIKMKAARKIGQLCQAQKETVGLNRGAAGGGAKDGPRGVLITPRDTRPTLAEQGVDKNLAKRSRVLGALTVPQFEVAIAKARDAIMRRGFTGVDADPVSERGFDCYPTPATAVWPVLARLERLRGIVWEPACFQGAIVRVLRAAGYEVFASDVVDYGFPGAKCLDFLKQTSVPPGVETVLTNPPFCLADEFVRHARKLGVPRIIMLLRTLFQETVGRTDILENAHLRQILVFRPRVQMHRHDWPGERSDSGKLSFAWYEWDQNYFGPTTWDRISPCGPPDVIDASGDLITNRSV
jgi:hypothetical protein